MERMKSKWEQILNKIHELEGICTCCGKKGCGHPNTTLPNTLKTDNVLEALKIIDLEGGE